MRNATMAANTSSIARKIEGDRVGADAGIDCTSKTALLGPMTFIVVTGVCPGGKESLHAYSPRAASWTSTPQRVKYAETKKSQTEPWSCHACGSLRGIPTGWLREL